MAGSQPLLQSFWDNGFLDSRHRGVPFLKGAEPVLHRSPQEIMDKIASLDAESAKVLKTIRGII